MYGARVVREIFREIASPRLRGQLVWIPMLPADHLQAALAQEEQWQEERVSQYWDAKRILGRAVAKGLALKNRVAWDVYLLYAPGAAWTGEGMPRPDFWMHQLDERVDLRLDAERLKREVQKAVRVAPNQSL